MKKLILILMLAVGVMGAGRSHWVEKYNTTEDTVLSNFDGGIGTEWVRVMGDSALDDYTNVKNGSKSIRAYCSGTTNCLLRKTFSHPIDISKYDFFVLTFRITDAQKYQIDSSGGNCFNFQIGTSTSIAYGKQFNISTVNDFGDSGWYSIQIHKKILVAAGTPSYDNCTNMYITLMARNGLSRAITIDQIKACKSVTPKGGVVFWFDASGDTVCKYVKKIFDRYNIKVTLSAKAQGLSVQTTPDSLIRLQSDGHDIVAYPWDPVDLTKYTPAGIDTQINKVKNYLVNYGLRGNSIIAFSQSRHNRVVDSVCYSSGFDFGRGLTLNTYATNIKWMSIPAYSGKYTIGHFTYQSAPLDSLKRIVDSAFTYGTVNTILFHGITTDTGIPTVIDTGKLDSLAKYCYTKMLSDSLGYVGKLTNYLLYAPDSCIVNKSRNVGVITDSISLLADSMKIILYDSTATGWDTVAISPMLPGGSLHTFTTATWSPGLYRLREWGIANSGTIDSGLAAFDYYVVGVPVDTIKVHSFSVINSSGRMFPASGWAVRVVRGEDDTLECTTGAQNEYGISEITPSAPLSTRVAPYYVVFVNGSWRIVQRHTFKKSGSSVIYNSRTSSATSTSPF